MHYYIIVLKTAYRLLSKALSSSQDDTNKKKSQKHFIGRLQNSEKAKSKSTTVPRNALIKPVFYNKSNLPPSPVV